MAEPAVSPTHATEHFKRWLLSERIEQVEGPETTESKGRQQSWWKVVCLTGVDYFSTLGYIPGIAALAAGALSPIATLLIVALTLLAMVPMYRRVASESPHGQGSIAILERVLSFWPGKLTVLVLLGFIATDFMITITLSASDAAVHLAENPLVHGILGDQRLLITLLLVAALGTIYDLSTIVILAFAGASALAGLLNVVPRYLPRYGMAPEWGRAVRPLVLIYTAITLAITVIFNANVDAQGGAYATGVLVIMTSAAFAVMLSALWNDNSLRATIAFGLVTLIFLYTLVANIFERPDGIKIASFFIVAIVIVSLASRVRRSLELRQERIELDEKAQRLIGEASKGDEIHIIAHRRRFADDPEEYARKLHEQREYNHIPEDVPVLFLEIDVEDPSEFGEEVLEVRGMNVGGYRVLRGESTVVPNAIAAFLLYLRDETGKTPNCYLGWTEGNPFAYVIRFILFGEGDTAPVIHEVLREAEPNLERRPIIHVGGK
jgi:hypothetical protein